LLHFDAHTQNICPRRYNGNSINVDAFTSTLDDRAIDDRLRIVNAVNS
jgi:hypothetical protein